LGEDDHLRRNYRDNIFPKKSFVPEVFVDKHHTIELQSPFSTAEEKSQNPKINLLEYDPINVIIKLKSTHTQNKLLLSFESWTVWFLFCLLILLVLQWKIVPILKGLLFSILSTFFHLQRGVPVIKISETSVCCGDTVCHVTQVLELFSYLVNDIVPILEFD
jgi:hypothetical protein